MKKLLMIIPVVLLVACSPEVKSVDYYFDNSEEAETVIKACEMKQGSKQDQNCINAKDAMYKKHMKSKTGGY